PTVGFGSAGAGGLGYGILPYNPAASALAESSGSLGTLAGINPSCINQIPPAEVVLQPPSVLVTIPGPILSASCEPTAVGGNTPCAISGSGIIGSRLYGNLLSGSLGLGLRGGPLLGRKSLLESPTGSQLAERMGPGMVTTKEGGWITTSAGGIWLMGCGTIPDRIAAMAFCPPSCTIPSCCSTPQFGLGSAGAFGSAPAGGLGLGGRGLGGGLQVGSMGGLQGGGISSGELGTLSGIVPQPINQIPPAEVVIQPPSFVVTIPGPILSASCDPVAIGGNTPCAAPGSGILGRPLAPSRGLLGGRNLQGGRGNVTLIPCGPRAFPGSQIQEQHMVCCLQWQQDHSWQRGWDQGWSQQKKEAGSRPLQDGGQKAIAAIWKQGQEGTKSNKGEREEDNLSIGISTASLEFSCLHEKISEEEIAAMALCPPTYVIPSCASTPQFGLGSAGGSAGLGLAGRGGLQGGSMGGLQGGSMSGLGGGLLGGGISSGELGTLSGIVPQPINQIPPAEVVIQPPSFIVTIPGPILSASCDPVAIGGNTPCAAPGSGILGRPLAPSRGLLGGRNLQGGRGNSNTKTSGHLHNILEDTFFFVHMSMCSRSHKPRLHFPKEPEITHDVLPPNGLTADEENRPKDGHNGSRVLVYLTGEVAGESTDAATLADRMGPGIVTTTEGGWMVTSEGGIWLMGYLHSRDPNQDLWHQLIQSQQLGWRRKMAQHKQVHRDVSKLVVGTEKQYKRGSPAESFHQLHLLLLTASPRVSLLHLLLLTASARVSLLFHPAMAYCGPSCAVPSCASAPAVGFESASARGLSWGLSYGGLGYGLGYGYGGGALAETSGSLGTLARVIPQPINQIPASKNSWMKKDWKKNGTFWSKHNRFVKDRCSPEQGSVRVDLAGEVADATSAPESADAATVTETPQAASELADRMGPGMVTTTEGGWMVTSEAGIWLMQEGMMPARTVAKTSIAETPTKTSATSRSEANSWGGGTRWHSTSRLTSQLNTMAYCGPSCAVPSCASAPAVGFGSAGGRGLGWGLGYGGLGYGLGYGRGLGYGYGAGALAETSGSLGTLAGVIPSCINQIPASEVTIQPPSVVVTIPGPILSASCEPVAVGGNTPCAPGGIGGIGGFGAGYFGGRLGRLGHLGRRGSICNLPC
ncbi:hypothetical protein E2320_014024, partial [Naja naja]